MTVRINFTRRYRPDWSRLHFDRAFGGCMDHIADGDGCFFDLDLSPQIGDIVLIRVPPSPLTGDSLTMKYLLQYNGRRVLASLDPPLPLLPHLQMLGPLVAWISYETPIRRDAEKLAGMAQEEVVAKAKGYGSPAYFMSVLGPTRAGDVINTGRVEPSASG